jgi:hypothetical protein
MGEHGPSRREFLEAASTAAVASLLWRGCDPDFGASGDSPPINASPIPEEQRTRMPADAYEDRRVVRVHDQRATGYSFGETENAALEVRADVVLEMLEAGIAQMARTTSSRGAWAALLPGDLATARVAVKVNMNGDEPHFLNTSPAMVVALAQSLVAAGVSAENILFFDRSRRFHEVYREAIDAAVPGLALLGADEVETDPAAVITAGSMLLGDGRPVSVPAPRALVEADHLINVHLLKGHFGGSTGSMKNLFGLARDVWGTFHGRSDLGLVTYEKGRQCADLALDPIVRSKSRLLVAEGVYGTFWHANKPPDRFRNQDLFPGGLPCSLVLGRNPLHHDMVLFDLLREERNYAPLDDGYDFYPDGWLQACARDPYRLGVFEHGRVVDGRFTAKDLAYEFIDYVSFATGR